MSPPIEMSNASVPFGCSAFGRLRSVLMHRPGIELDLVQKENADEWLFDSAPDRARIQQEHDRFRETLIAHGVEVYALSSFVHRARILFPRLPNLMYLNDTAVVTDKGAIFSSMAHPVRRHESLAVKEALGNLGIPSLIELDGPEDALEGVMALSGSSLMVFHTERSKYTSVHKFIQKALRIFDEVIYIDLPKARRFAHPNRVFNQIRRDLALAYLPVLQDCFMFRRGYVRKLNFPEYLERKGVELVGVSDEEQRGLACAFLLLESGKLMHFEQALLPATRDLLDEKGVRAISIPSAALSAGGGGPQCLTLEIHRERAEP